MQRQHHHNNENLITITTVFAIMIMTVRICHCHHHKFQVLSEHMSMYVLHKGQLMRMISYEFAKHNCI